MQRRTAIQKWTILQITSNRKCTTRYQRYGTSTSKRATDAGSGLKSSKSQIEFSYTRRNSQSRFIRVIQIFPRASDDEIMCTINSIHLDDDPTYLALSYTWSLPYGNAGEPLIDKLNDSALNLRAVMQEVHMIRELSY
jgi:hypothetical protein